MIRYTNEFLTDGDITIERVANRLKLISEGIKNSNKLNLCDINVICEEIFGKILNTLYGYELVTIGVQGKPHYVAIDLVDKKNKVAYQVTSTVRRSKIEGTTEKFVKNKLYKDIDELYILILNDDPHKYRNDNNEIDIKTTKKFTIKNNVINFEKLITEIETKSKNNPKLLTLNLEFFRCRSRRLPEEFFRIKKLFLTQKLPGRCASPASGSGQLFWLFFIKQSF